MYVVWSCYSFFLLFTFIVLKMVFEVGIYLNSNRWCCCCCCHCNYYFYLLFIHVSEKKTAAQQAPIGSKACWIWYREWDGWTCTYYTAWIPTHRQNYTSLAYFYKICTKKMKKVSTSNENWAYCDQRTYSACFSLHLASHHQSSRS